MQNYKIFTDSCCDLPHNLVEELNLTVVPLSFTMGGEIYQNYSDNREMSPSHFYQRLRRGEVATTSAANVGQLQEAMGATLIEGQDILMLAFTSALSTTYQSTVIAANDLREQYPKRKILVVDTLSASMGQGLLVYLAAQKQRSGASLEEVRDWVEINKGAVCHQFTVDELGCLKRGGRISATTAVVGTMLAVKPLLHVDDQGKLVSIGKSRGRSAALKALVARMEETILPENDTIFLSHGDCLDEVEPLAQMLQEKYPSCHMEISPIGPVIGAHAGPGTVAVFYLGTAR